MLDFSNEQEQSGGASVVIPENSLVWCQISLIKTNNVTANDLHQTRSGLLQLPLKLEVSKGSYAGSWFAEYITVPQQIQQLRQDQLSNGQITSCRIGGSTIRAICEMALNTTHINSFQQLNNKIIPVQVGIKEVEREKDNRTLTFYNNTLKKVITSSMSTLFSKIANSDEWIDANGFAGEKKQAVEPQNSYNSSYLISNNNNNNRFDIPDDTEYLQPVITDEIPF